MNRFFTLLLAASCLTAVGQVPDYVPADGLVAWYPFSGNADDQSGNDLNGSVNGAVLSADRHGLGESAYYFSGNFPEFIALPELDSNLGQPGSRTSISLWFMPEENSLTGSGQLIHASHEGYPEIFARIEATQSGSVKIYHRNSTTNNEPAGGVSPIGEWSFLCAVIDQESGSYNMWLNGELLESIDFSFDPSESYYSEGRSWEIGAISAALPYHQFKGIIDDVTVHNRILTEAEIAGLYMAEAPTAGCTDSSACNFNAEANLEDGSCHFLCQYCKAGTVWDEAIQGCVVANPADINLDGCVQLNDLLDLLSAYGDCGVEESPWQCGDPLEYQGYNYETVQIGEQCWFAENCRYLPYLNEVGDGSDVDPRYYVLYEDHTDLLQAQESSAYLEYGALYNLPAVLVGEELCPSGWHIPNIQEWEELGAFASDLGPNSLKDESWGGGASGFDARAAGHRADYGEYIREFEESDFWSVTVEPNCVNHVARLISDEIDLMTSDLMLHCDSGNSVRCIKD